MRLFLGRSCRRCKVVKPLRVGWKTHEYRFGSAVGLQAEARAAIPHEIEFNISAAANCLPLLVFFGEGEDGILFHKVSVYRRKGKANVPDESEPRCAVEARGIAEVIEEYSPDSPGFLAMFQEEILISQFFEVRVVGGMVPVAHFLERPVKPGSIFGVDVVGCEVDAAAKPPGAT